MPKFKKVAKLKEVPPGRRKLVEVDGFVVALFNIDGAICAIEDVCTHDGGPLAEGQIVRPGVIACPRHGAEFDLCTGAALTLPAFEPANTFEVKVEGGSIYVESYFS
ncbi:MAG: non-heme iron oxygenase ferredoxin subunit [Caldilineales bacterium]|nr:non-heme iron oxygenase ferredoxin subunit [Caldilineales bacterium]MCW5861071.1 non-heme iron oxygenase ferredoxin subunit [Caldilineales bacterium]